MATLLTVFLLLMAGIWSPLRTARATTASEGQLVMGTVLEVQVKAKSATMARELALEAVGIARHWDDVLSTFRPDAELADLLRRRGSRTYVTPDLQYALARMQTLAGATRGAFDPAFSSDLDCNNAEAKFSGKWFCAVEVGPRWAWVHPLADIDPGAIGKGIAIDAILAALATRGAREVFVNFGGSSFAVWHSQSEGHSGRRILIPSFEGTPLGTLDLRHGSLSTSESRPRDGARSIFDPRSGTPVTSPRLAAAWAADATSADAWSTALVVLGRAGLPLAQSHGIEAMIVDAEGLACTKHFPWAHNSEVQPPC
jgi:thiamine biosynthesis lipoprotein ApbE